jgi:alcohol dehydrogenase (quinone), cytochrome c subunit
VSLKLKTDPPLKLLGYVWGPVPWMVEILLLAGVGAVLCAWLVALAFGGRGGDRSAVMAVPVTPDLVARGAYLAQAGDCAACHTAPGGGRFAGGLAIASPIGVMFSSNITPDRQTGIGSDTYGDFERAVRRGILRSGGTMYPAMPYPSFSRITDSDLQALYAYFMHGVSPVSSKNKAEQIVWPLSIRWPLTYWRWLFAPQEKAFAPSPGEDPVVARGGYLVEGLGHCGACHTPRALTMEEVALTPQGGPRYLAGSQFNGWFAPSLRGGTVAGIGRWTDADIEAFLGGGRTKGFAAFGEMGVVVTHSTQFMSVADRAAVASFLRTLPPSPDELNVGYASSGSARLAAAGVVRAGSQIYFDNCAVCHQADGTGAASGFPALAGNPAVNSKDPVSVIHIVLDGGAMVQTRAATSPLVMPPIGASLSDGDVADLLTYVRSSWGNHAPPVTSSQVRKLRRAIGGPQP